MQCIAALDYEHLDDGKFLLKLARSISDSAHLKPLIIHDNSANTERIMQQGVMRGEAEIQDIKTLNHRLVNLFADEGVSAVGIHGYQKRAITYKNGQLSLEQKFFDKLPPVSLLLSTLVWDEEAQSNRRVELPYLVNFLMEALDAEPVYGFSLKESIDDDIPETLNEVRWNDLPENFEEQYIPGEFKGYQRPLRLISAQSFGLESPENHSVFIHE